MEKLGSRSKPLFSSEHQREKLSSTVYDPKIFFLKNI
jgi:hypothetical protein